MADFAYTHALSSRRCQHLQNWEICSRFAHKSHNRLLRGDSTGFDRHLDNTL